MFNKDVVQQELNSGLSLSEICDRDGLSYSRAYYWCKKNEVAVSRANNGKSATTLGSRRGSRVFCEVHKDVLYQMYVTEQRSLGEIAKHFSTTEATVAASLRRFDIPVKLKNGKYNKVKPTQSKAVLEQLYINQYLSTHEIAKLLGYKHHGQVVEEMKYYNIDRLSYSDAGILLYQKHPDKRELHRDQFYAGITGPKNNTTTSLEQTFIDWAVSNHIKFVYQFQIRKNWHRYDFLISDTSIIVEMDGDFWHSLPEHVARDAKFDETAKAHGYTVVRIRESDVKYNKDIFNERILPLIKETIDADT